LATAAAVHAQTRLYVDASAPAGGNGQSWNAAFRDLQDALTLANGRPNHGILVEIRVAQGVYNPDQGTHDRARTFTVGSGVSLRGGFVGIAAGLVGDPDQNDPARFVSVLSGDLLHDDAPSESSRADNSYLLMSVAGSFQTVDGFTMRGAAAAVSAGGTNGCVIQRCTITDNVQTPATVGNPALPTPIVSMSAGALYTTAIVDNRSSLGSILHIASAPIWRCTIAGNRLAHDGSALPLAGAAIDVGTNCSLDACLVAANTSETYCLSTACGIAMYNCTIVDNRCPSAPGVAGCALLMYDCLFSRNVATAAPGPTWPQVSGYGPYLRRCFLDHGVSDVQATGGTITATFTFSGSPGFVNASGPDNDPTTWRDNDYRLAAGSVCIDSGDSLYIPGQGSHVDLNGLAPFDDPGAANTGSGPVAIVDIGAIERAPTPCPADFDHSGTLTTLDLMNFISAWLSGSPSADFDHSGTLTAHDVLEYIDVWFVGCPA
jgi:hypothetical protein